MLSRADVKPPTLEVRPENIPAGLRACEQWVCWRWDWKPDEKGGGRWSKLPVDCANGRSASSTDPNTWAPYEDVLAYYQANRSTVDGIGFVFKEGGGHVGVDLDECVGPGGHLKDWGDDLVSRLGSYTEISPTGTGVKVFLRGSCPGPHHRRPYEDGEVEVYDQKRFFCVTGHRLDWTPDDVLEQQPAVDDVYRLVFTPVATEAPDARGSDAAPCGPVVLAAIGMRADWTDEELLRLATAARNGDKLRRLWDGDTSDYGNDDSRADLALCGLLAFWTGRNADRLDRLFRQSKLMRPKWDERRGERTYGRITIDTALATRTEFYDDPGQPAERGSRGDPAVPRAHLQIAEGTASDSDAWPEPQPIPDDLPPVLPFDSDLLPESLRAYVADVAERMQCPPDFPAVATIVSLAGAVGKKVGIRPKRQDDWLVVPNLWGAVIGRPGIMKTPALRQPFRFLLRLEVEAKTRHEQQMRDYNEQCLVAEVRKKEKRKAIEEAIRTGEDPINAAKRFTVDEPEEPSPKRYVVNDSTVEKLGEMLNQNPCGLTVFRDELVGLFRQLDKDGQEGARAFYLEAWDGLGKFTYDRIGRGTIHIETVTLSLLGGIQPGRLLDYLGAALKGGGGDDGLIQRFQLLVYPDVSRKWKNVDRWPDTAAKQHAWAVFQRLDTLDPAAIGAQREDGDDDGVPFLRFTAEAQDAFDAWREALEEQVRSGDEHPAVESHLAKYRSLVPAVALLLHLADDRTGPVGGEAVRKAIGWAVYLESHARRVYSVVVNSGAVAGKALARRIRKGELKDGFTLRDLYRKHWTGLSEKDAVEQATDLLLDLGWLLETVEETGGRTKVRYRINPAVLAETAGRGSAKSAKSPEQTPFGTNGTEPPGHF
jgi:putative DNA primase/helicase